jgi:hypothetical protein
MGEPAIGPQERQLRTHLPKDYVVAPLSEVDPEIGRVLERELHCQRNTLEMIASENFVPHAILEAVGSVLTNKYAEGYPGKRYYRGGHARDSADHRSGFGRRLRVRAGSTVEAKRHAHGSVPALSAPFCRPCGRP